MSSPVTPMEKRQDRDAMALAACKDGVFRDWYLPLSKYARERLTAVRRVHREVGRRGVRAPVYLMRAANADGLFKVGYSADPVGRAKVLSAAGAYSWRVCIYYGFGGIDLEGQMHAALQDKHVFGETFEGHLDDMIGVSARCAISYLRGPR